MRNTVVTQTPYQATYSPSIAQYSQSVLFGDIWKRPGLSPRDRSLVTISNLISLYRINELPYHIGLALDNGLSIEEIDEVITHLAFYAGWPTAYTAFPIVQKVLEERRKTISTTPEDQDKP